MEDSICNTYTSSVTELASWAPTKLHCWRIHYDDVHGSVVSATIFHDNEYAGNIKLAITNTELEIVTIYLFEKYQRQGFLRDYVNALVRTAPSSIDTILVYASGDGAGVWHKLGFKPFSTYSAQELWTTICSLDLDALDLHNRLFASQSPIETLLFYLESKQELELMSFFPWHGQLRLNSPN